MHISVSSAHDDTVHRIEEVEAVKIETEGEPKKEKACKDADMPFRLFHHGQSASPHEKAAPHRVAYGYEKQTNEHEGAGTGTQGCIEANFKKPEPYVVLEDGTFNANPH